MQPVELEKYRSHQTTMISMIIPDGYNIHEVSEQLSNEISTCENIKSKETRKLVGEGLRTLRKRVQSLGQTPTNGVAIYVSAEHCL